MLNSDQIASITTTILASKKYKDIYPKTVERIVTDYIDRFGPKRAELEARNKLHQIWGAYWQTRPNFDRTFKKNESNLQQNPQATLHGLLTGILSPSVLTANVS